MSSAVTGENNVEPKAIFHIWPSDTTQRSPFPTPGLPRDTPGHIPDHKTRNQTELNELSRPKPGQYNPHRAEHDRQVEPDGQVFDVVEVVFEFFHGVFDAGGVALLDLGPAGDAGFDSVAPLIKGDLALKLLYKLDLFGTGTDDAHVALQNIPQLRQLVQAEAAQDTAHGSDTIIIVAGKLGAISLCVNPHGAKFHDAKRASALPDTVLPKQDGTGRADTDQEGRHEAQRNGHGQGNDDEY